MRPLRPTALLLGVALLGGACTASTGLGDEYRELVSARVLWQRQQLDEYQFLFRASCECPGELTTSSLVTVRGGEVVEVLGPSSTVRTLPAETWPTVPELFARVEDAISQRAVQLDVDYHPTLGYPTRISVDYRREVVDDEFVWTATELAPPPGQ